MAIVVGVREARGRFSELLERAKAGESISVTRRGEEVARIEPPSPKVDRRPGRMKGRIWAAPDWDETPQDIIDLMEGKDEEW